jgi:hypothetical protein
MTESLVGCSCSQLPQLALTRRKNRTGTMQHENAPCINPRVPRNQFFEARGRKASKSFCKPMASQNAHLTQPKPCIVMCKLLQREKFFRFCKRLHYIPKMCFNPAAMSPLASHDHTPAAATGLLFFLAHIHPLARRI